MWNPMEVRDFAKSRWTYWRSESYRYFNRMCELTEQFWLSRWYFPFLLTLATVFLLLDQQVMGVAVLVVITTWFLALCPDALAALCPFMILFLLAGPEYRDLSVFLPCAPLALPLLLAALLHLALWPQTIRVGSSGYGLVLVSLATIFGGSGVISTQDYFRPLSLYYTVGLGVGLLVLYVLFRSHLARRRSYDLCERFLAIFYAIGMMAILLVLVHYVHHFEEFLECRGVLSFKYRNFCATVLLTTLPMPFYFARKKRIHLAVCVLFEAALVLTGSRSALLFGAVLTVFCCIYLVRYGVVSWRVMLAIGVVVAAAMVLFGADYMVQFYDKRFAASGYFNRGDQTRLKLLACSVSDFLRHPLFGIGLGSSAHADVFSGVPGSMTFYHNAVAQIIGSMGLLGIVAYGRLALDQFALLRKERTPFTSAMLLSYLGMLMVSMTNPGMFCPFPNAAMLVMGFAMVEEAVGDVALPVTQLLTSRRYTAARKHN